MHGQGAQGPHSRTITASSPPFAASRPGWTDVDCAEEEALEKLDSWLSAHGWRDVQAHLLDAGYTCYEKYSEIEPQMMALDEPAGLYLHQGRTLQLVGADRYNPTLLIDIENRRVMWDFQTETQFANPWARQHFVCKVEGRSSMILLKRTGKVVARHDSGTEVSLVSPDPARAFSASPGIDMEGTSSESENGEVPVSAHRPNPASSAHNSALPVPIVAPRVSHAGIAPSNRAVPARPEWKPNIVARDKTLPVLEKLVDWASANGWHDLQRRLLDAGKTDYSQYALHEKVHPHQGLRFDRLVAYLRSPETLTHSDGGEYLCRR